MKIAHLGPPSLIPPKSYGGTQRLIFALAKKQAEHGHEVTVFAGPGSEVPGCKAKSFISEDWIDKRFLGKKVLGTRHVLKCYSKIGDEYDIIHNHVWEEGIALSFLAKVPVLTTIHGQAHKKFIQKTITKICSLTKKTKLVSISANAFKQNKKFYGKDLLGFVYNCIESSNLNFSKIPSKKHEIELCFLGLFATEKGPHIAIQLAEKLNKSGKDVRLKLAGKIDQSNKAYSKRIYSLTKNKPYIEIMPNIPNSALETFFGNSDALLFPILWDEPFGLVMIESLFCGTPVIGLSNGSVPEIIKNGVNGFVCNNEDEMYKAILSIGNIDRKNCHTFVQNEFNPETTYNNYMKYYKKTIEQNKK